jgi:hypothetical protein
MQTAFIFRVYCCSRHINQSCVHRQRINAFSLITTIIYSPRRKTTIYTHVSTVQAQMYMMLFERGDKLFVYKIQCSHSDDCWTLLRHASNDLGGTFSKHFLHLLLGLYCCPFGDVGWASLGLGCPPHAHTIPKANSLYSRIQALSQCSVGHSCKFSPVWNVVLQRQH